MPDQSDVEAALVAAACGALYPDGTGGAPAAGVVCRVFRGFPAGAVLGAELVAGGADVSVSPVEGSYRNTTRFLSAPVCEPVRPGLRVVASGDAVTVSGDAGAGQLAGVLVDGSAYVYRTGIGDTPAVVAAALAALVRVDRPAVLAGASVTFPGAFRVLGRAVADTPDVVELRRQSQEFRVVVWAPSAASRDVVAGVLDVAFAQLRFLDVGGAGCPVTAAGTATSDDAAAAGLFRRDLLLTVEYPTTAVVERPAMLFGTLVEGARSILA